MRTKVSLALIAGIFLWLAGVAQAQQIGIGRYERLQIAAHDLEEQARALHARAERFYPRYRSDRELVLALHRLEAAARNFHDEVERNFDDRRDVRTAYQRLLYAVSDADLALRRSYRYRSFAYNFREMTRDMNQIQRLMPGAYDRYDDDHDYDRRDHDYDDDYDYR